VPAARWLPLFTLLGQTWGWRASFVAVAAAGTGVLVAATVVLPSLPTTPESQGAGEQLRTALAPRVLAVLALCCLVFAGIQSALTYLVPYLGDVTGVTGAGVTAFLLVYGVASLIGSVTGGRFADLDAGRTLIVGTIGLSGSLLALYLLGDNPVLAAAAVLCVGLCAGVAPSLRHRVETLAGPGAPFAASLPASAVYVGIAVGSAAGGVAIDRVGIPAAVLTGAVLAAFATAVALVTSRLRPAAAHDERGSAS
jgi:DHA1 family inner membrane transport protein